MVPLVRHITYLLTEHGKEINGALGNFWILVSPAINQSLAEIQSAASLDQRCERSRSIHS